MTPLNKREETLTGAELRAELGIDDIGPQDGDLVAPAAAGIREPLTLSERMVRPKWFKGDGPAAEARSAATWVSITWAGVPAVSTRKNRGNTTHWTRREDVQAMREGVRGQLLNMRPLPHFKKARIHVCQAYCGQPLDFEGLASGMGPAVDAFVDAGVIDDDEPVKFVVDYTMSHERVDHMVDRFVSVTVTEAT